jgi:hypothetical protein
VLEPSSPANLCVRRSCLLDLYPEAANSDFTRVLDQEPLHLDALVGRAYDDVEQDNVEAALSEGMSRTLLTSTRVRCP